MLRRRWPQVKGLMVAGFGYAAPYLEDFAGEAARLLALMPAPQGVGSWAAAGGNASCLVEEAAWPLPEQSVDRLVLAHALEFSDQTGALLNEAYRTLAGNGRLLVLVPHRHGLWAQSDATPFGYGFAFSAAHVKRLLAHHRFQVEGQTRALFWPPFAHRWLPRAGAWAEKWGRRWLPALAGILIIEASKQVYIPRRVEAAKVDAPLLHFPGLATPTPAARVTHE